MQGAGMQGANIQGGGQPGGFSPGQNQVTPQDHEKVNNAAWLPPYAQILLTPFCLVTCASTGFSELLWKWCLLLELFMILLTWKFVGQS